MALDQGSHRSGPGQFIWRYGKGDPNKPISTQTGQWVAAPGGEGYYVDKHIGTVGAKSVRVAQYAQFIEDRWQVTDRLLLNLGLRNDQFTNYNPDGVPYLRLTKPQWAPRLGASWDVHGDSSLKVYANAGRYYMAEPANVAIRGAAGSIVTDQYFTYTGIDPATGAPTGLTQIPQGNYPAV
jgi:outer membrane receptor protein involved in Fe transport